MAAWPCTRLEDVSEADRREALRRLREELGIGLPSLDSETWTVVCELAEEHAEEQAREWLARYEYRTSQEFKDEVRAFRKALAGEGLTSRGWADKACVRPYRKPNCTAWRLGPDGRCRGQEVCPDWKEHPKPGPRPPEPCEQPELFGDWEDPS
jgi:hypothetical protein